jgi:hypothetical protein
MTKGRARAADGEGEEPLRCQWCRKVILVTKPVGRPRKFCSQSCRQWEWVASQRARASNLGADELIVARAELDGLRDDLYVLACAVEDVERDLASSKGRATIADLREHLDWLLDAARPLRDREIAVPGEAARGTIG